MDLLKTKPQLAACIDSNVFISAIAFGGTPLKVLKRALDKEFQIITSHHILNEVSRNLTGKLGLPSDRVDSLIKDIAEVSSLFVPSGKVKFIEHKQDNLVLEVAFMGWSNVLVTGDRRHLLPLNVFQGLIIESPSKFLIRLDDWNKPS